MYNKNFKSNVILFDILIKCIALKYSYINLLSLK